jgi:tetrahydromethanopterin S-methyltransferase subunit B
MGEISSEELTESKNSIVNELMEINEELNKLDQKDDVLLTNLDNTVELFVELYFKWKSYSYEKKLRVINYMVVELVIDNNKEL